MRARLLSILLVAASTTGCFGGCFDPLWPSLPEPSDPPTEPERPCEFDDQCPEAGWRCDEASQRCFFSCSLDSDCPSSMLCCVEQVELRAQRVCVEAGSCSTPTCPPEAPLAIDRACHMRCVEDADCPLDGEACCDALPEPLCMTSETCARSLPCEEGWAPDAEGFCLHTCTSIEACYPLGAYCAIDQLCHGTLAGEGLNACAAALAAPEMEPSAPLLYYTWSLDLDPATPEACRPEGRCGAGRFACGAAIQLWDPDGDLPTGPSELFDAIDVLLEDGSDLVPYAVELSEGEFDVLTFEVCVDATSLFRSAAIRMQDRAGHGSNALCLSPQAP